MVFPDYFDLVDPLVLPIRGKQYTIPVVSFQDMARWKTYSTKKRDGVELADTEIVTNNEFHHIFLGSVLDEMIADGLPENIIIHAAATAMADAEATREVAERVWVTLDPKDLMPSPKPSSEDSPQSPSTGGATSTKPRAHTRATTSRRK